MSVVRWKFKDLSTNEEETLPVNPSSATSPFPGKVIASAKGPGFGGGGINRPRLFQSPSPPAEWSFGGLIRSQADRDQLLRWSKKSSTVSVSDHLGRTFEVIIQRLEVVERQPTPTRPWRMTYTLNVLALRRTA